MTQATAKPADSLGTLVSAIEAEEMRRQSRHRIEVAKGMMDVGVAAAIMALIGGVAYKVITSKTEVSKDAALQS
jgi:hypothetical protein